VIVVIGSAAFQPGPAAPGRAAGLAPEIAAEAAAAGATVELLTRVGDDGAGEELLLALARTGVGHLAVLRDPAGATALTSGALDEATNDDGDLALALLAEAEAVVETNIGVQAGSLPPDGSRTGASAPPREPVLEPADVSLGLRYLRDFRVVVAVEPIADGAAPVIAEAAAFAGAVLVVVARPGAGVPEDYAGATVFEAPPDDPERAFARLVGRYAAALDDGVDAGAAFRAATESGGWAATGD